MVGASLTMTKLGEYILYLQTNYSTQMRNLPANPVIRFALYCAALLTLSTCSNPDDDVWSNINYADIQCGNGKAQSPSANCKNDDNSISAVGKGKR